MSGGGNSMSFTVHVKMKKLRKAEPVDIAPVGVNLTRSRRLSRELLVNLTRLASRQYNERKDEGQLLAFDKGGKLRAGNRWKDFSGRALVRTRCEDKAVENTLQCFEDHLPAVCARRTDRPFHAIPWKDDIVFTFIRLTMLSGWNLRRIQWQDLLMIQRES